MSFARQPPCVPHGRAQDPVGVSCLAVAEIKPDCPELDGEADDALGGCSRRGAPETDPLRRANGPLVPGRAFGSALEAESHTPTPHTTQPRTAGFATRASGLRPSQNHPRLTSGLRAVKELERTKML